MCKSSMISTRIERQNDKGNLANLARDGIDLEHSIDVYQETQACTPKAKKNYYSGRGRVKDTSDFFWFQHNFASRRISASCVRI